MFFESWDAWVSYVGSGHMLVRDIEGRYLVCHRSHKDDWMYPGGLRDTDHCHHLETAKREFFEETGALFPGGSVFVHEDGRRERTPNLCERLPEKIGSRVSRGGGEHIVYFVQLTVPMAELPGLKGDSEKASRNGAQLGGPIDQHWPSRPDAECDRWSAVTTEELQAMVPKNGATLRNYCEEYCVLADNLKPRPRPEAGCIARGE